MKYPNYLSLPGITGNNASTPNAVPIQLVNNLDVVVKIQFTRRGRPLVDKAIVNKYDSAGNQRSWRLVLMSTGVLRATLSSNGTGATDYNSTVAIPGTLSPLWIRLVFTPNSSVQFFTAPDQRNVPTSWTQLGATIPSVLTGLFNCNQALRIGASTTASEVIRANIYRVIVNNVFDCDFSTMEQGQVVINESANNAVVTINRAGVNKAKIAGQRSTVNAYPQLYFGANSLFTDVVAPTITKTNTPFNTQKFPTSGGYFTPIWSTANNVYLTLPVTVTAQQQTRLARLNKSLVVQENVQTRLATFNPDPGHAQSSVATDRNGLVVTFPEGHDVPWFGQHTTTAENLSTLVSTATPLPLSTGATNYSYRRYFRNPNNGDLFLVHRGYGYNGYLRKWDETNRIWINRGTNDGIVGWGAPFDNSFYGLDLAWHTDGTMYAVIEFSNGGPDYPRRDAVVMKSVDDGTTWLTLSDKQITLPLAPIDSSLAMPSPNQIRNITQVRIAVGTDGQPIVIGAYRQDIETTRSLYYARWNNDNQQFVYRKIQNFSTANFGNASVMTHAGKIYILVGGLDEHADPNWTSTGPVYTPWVNKTPLYLFVSADNCNTFSRYTLDNGLGATAFWGGYFDPEAPRLDNKMRIIPICGTDFAESQIWEFAIP